MSRTWEGRPIRLAAATVDLNVFVDDVLIGHLLNSVPAIWRWRHVSGRNGWDDSRGRALDALLSAHSETVRDWADR